MTTRFAFVTGHEFGRRALDGLLASDPSLAGDLTCDLLVELDSSRTSATVGFTSCADLADQHDLKRVVTTDGSLVGVTEALEEAAPHYLLVIGWSRLVAPDILDLPARIHGNDNGRNAPGHGCVGMHPTRLPEGRGQAPIPWTIIRGLHSTALSVFNLEDGADTGALLAQYDVAVRDRETSASLFARFAQLHFRAGYELGPRMATRELSGTPQDDAVATVWPKRRPADSRLTLSLSSVELDATVRALSGPYPRAFVRLGGHDVRVTRTRLVGSSGADIDRGRVFGMEDDELFVKWGSGTLVALQVDGRDRALCNDLVSAGDRLTVEG